MQLPAKALFALIDIKKELLATREVETKVETAHKRLEDAAPSRTFRHPHAKTSVCTTAKFWSSFR